MQRTPDIPTKNIKKIKSTKDQYVEEEKVLEIHYMEDGSIEPR